MRSWCGHVLPVSVRHSLWTMQLQANAPQPRIGVLTHEIRGPRVNEALSKFNVTTDWGIYKLLAFIGDSFLCAFLFRGRPPLLYP
jgi:hypothetical protein